MDSMKTAVVVDKALAAGFTAELLDKALAAGFTAELMDKALAAGFNAELFNKFLDAGFNAMPLVDEVLTAGFPAELVHDQEVPSKHGMFSKECSCFVSAAAVRRCLPVVGIVAASAAVNGIVGAATPATALGHFVLLLCGLSMASLPFLGA